MGRNSEGETMGHRPKRRPTVVRCTACGRGTTWHQWWTREGRCLACADPQAAARAADERRARILARTREEI